MDENDVGIEEEITELDKKDIDEELEAWCEEVVAKGTFKSKEDAIKLMALLGIEFANHFRITRDVFKPKYLPIDVESLTRDLNDSNEEVFDWPVMDAVLDRITAGTWSAVLKPKGGRPVVSKIEDKRVKKEMEALKSAINIKIGGTSDDKKPEQE